MSTLTDALALRRLREDSAAWSLLRAENAPIAAAVLDRHLGGEERRLPVDDVPAYGTIILDEAFDKADSTFTRMAMDVFLEFGFHMILATPLKLLQTLESYVDGVSYVTCRDHNDSRIGTVPIEAEAS